MGSALLRLPFPSVRQGGKISEIKTGQRIEASPQPCQGLLWLTELLSDSSEHSTDARRLRGSDLKQPLKPTRLAQIGEQLLHRLLRGQLAPLSAVAEKVEQCGIGFG